MPRVLIIEDNETDCLLLQRFLGKRWAHCDIEVADRREQLDTTLMQHWDLIISDYHLLDIEGDELLHRIYAEQPATPCLLMSGSLYEIRDIAVPGNVFAKLEKGDYDALDDALKHAPSR